MRLPTTASLHCFTNARISAKVWDDSKRARWTGERIRLVGAANWSGDVWTGASWGVRLGFFAEGDAPAVELDAPLPLEMELVLALELAEGSGMVVSAPCVWRGARDGAGPALLGAGGIRGVAAALDEEDEEDELSNLPLLSFGERSLLASRLRAVSEETAVMVVGWRASRESCWL